MTILILIIHVTACIALIGLVLIQRGRGSGLVESFSGVETMFGTKTDVFLTKATTILSVVFFVTCLSLALISIRQSRSLMRDVKPAVTAAQPTEKAATEQAANEAQAQQPPIEPSQALAPAAEPNTSTPAAQN